MFTSTAWDCNCEAFHVCFVALASFWYLNCRLHGALHVSKAPSESKWSHFGPLSPFEIRGAGRSAVTLWSTQRRKVPASHGPGHKTFTEEKSSSAQKAGVDELQGFHVSFFFFLSFVALVCWWNRPLRRFQEFLLCLMFLFPVDLEFMGASLTFHMMLW